MGSVKSEELERRRFIAWAKRKIRKRCSGMGVPYHPSHVAHMPYAEYDIVFLAVVEMENEDGEIELIPVTWIHVDKTEALKGEDEDSAIIELKEPTINTVVPELVFVRTPEGEYIYKKLEKGEKNAD